LACTVVSTRWQPTASTSSTSVRSITGCSSGTSRVSIRHVINQRYFVAGKQSVAFKCNRKMTIENGLLQSFVGTLENGVVVALPEKPAEPIGADAGVCVTSHRPDRIVAVKLVGQTLFLYRTDGTVYRFVERARLRVLALPLKTSYNGTVLSVPNDSWKSMWEFTRNAYPVAANGLVWTIRDELDVSAHNIEADEGQRGVWEALANLNPPHCAANKQADGCYDKIIGFTPARARTYPNGTNQGYTYGSPANIVVATDEDAPATVAHEIAHNFGIGDAYNGGSFACGTRRS